MIRLAPVNYTNTYPLLMHLTELEEAGELSIESMMPSAIPLALREGRIDLGLAPVGGLHLLPEYHVVGGYGIGTEAEVASVCMFSDVPVDQIETVLLDYQSRSSTALLRWLFRFYYKKEVEFMSTSDDSYISQIRGTTAGLVIGDRAFELLGQTPYVYDLGREWNRATGLPFVFAVWVSTWELPSDFVHRFDALQERGVSDIEAVIAKHALSEHSYDMHRYYTQNISYKLTEKHLEAMHKFLRETAGSTSIL